MEIENRLSWDNMFMEIAKIVAKRSKDPRTKVGAVLVKNNHLLGIGYNGEPRNFKGKFNWNTEEKYKYVIHAEMNAITNATNIGANITGATIYLTLSPCNDCIKLLIQNQIKKIIYLEEYKDIEFSKKIANNAGIQMILFNSLKNI